MVTLAFTGVFVVGLAVGIYIGRFIIPSPRGPTYSDLLREIDTDRQRFQDELLGTSDAHQD